MKKKILTKNKSFDDVLEEVKAYFKLRGKLLPPTLLHDILIKIGLPKVKLIIQDEDIELEQIDSARSEMRESASYAISKPESIHSSQKIEPLQTEPSSEKSTENAPVVPAKIGETEVEDIVEALSVVESLSDSFMTPHQADDKIPAKQQIPQISINLQGVEEIQATDSSQATVVPMESISQKSEIKPRSEPENQREPIHEIEMEDHEISHKPTDIIPEVPISDVEPSVMTKLSPLKETSTAIIKPLIEKKAIILGEEEVGKKNLLSKAGLSPILAEDLSTPYIYEKTFETETHRVKLKVWSFDQASLQGLSRKQFYADVDVAIIVYSAVDRWSFQSIDFWLKEAGACSDQLPPLIIVANKIDLRDIAGPQAVSHQEGYALAETLAKSYGSSSSLHPIGFIETSCVTGEGINALFQLAAELSIKTTCNE